MLRSGFARRAAMSTARPSPDRATHYPVACRRVLAHRSMDGSSNPASAGLRLACGGGSGRRFLNSPEAESSYPLDFRIVRTSA